MSEPFLGFLERLDVVLLVLVYVTFASNRSGSPCIDSCLRFALWTTCLNTSSIINSPSSSSPKTLWHKTLQSGQCTSDASRAAAARNIINNNRRAERQRLAVAERQRRRSMPRHVYRLAPTLFCRPARLQACPTANCEYYHMLQLQFHVRRNIFVVQRK